MKLFVKFSATQFVSALGLIASFAGVLGCKSRDASFKEFHSEVDQNDSDNGKDGFFLATYGEGQPVEIPEPDVLLLNEKSPEWPAYLEMKEFFKKNPVLEGQEKLASVICFNEKEKVQVPNVPITSEFGYTGSASNYFMTDMKPMDRKFLWQFNPRKMKDYLGEQARGNSKPSGCFVLDSGVNLKKLKAKVEKKLDKKTIEKKTVTAMSILGKAVKCGFSPARMAGSVSQDFLIRSTISSLDLIGTITSTGASSLGRGFYCAASEYLTNGTPWKVQENQNVQSLMVHFQNSLKSSKKELEATEAWNVFKNLDKFKKKLENQAVSKEMEEKTDNALGTLSHLNFGTLYPTFVKNFNASETIYKTTKNLVADSNILRIMIKNAAEKQAKEDE